MALAKRSLKPQCWHAGVKCWLVGDRPWPRAHSNLCACASRRSGGPEVRAVRCARRARRGRVDEILVWRVRAVATGTVRWSLDTAHHGFDTMGPCVIALESGKVKGFEKQKGRRRRVGRRRPRRRRPAAASRPSGRGELRDNDTLTIAAEKITFATRNRGNPSRRVADGAGEGAPASPAPSPVAR